MSEETIEFDEKNGLSNSCVVYRLTLDIIPAASVAKSSVTQLNIYTCRIESEATGEQKQSHRPAHRK